MKKKELLGLILLLGAALAFSGCSNVTYSDRYSHKSFSLNSLGVGGSADEGQIVVTDQGPFSSATLAANKVDIKVLGPVTVEAEGVSKVLLVFERGDNGYAKLFAEAKKKYPDMDALVNIMEDIHRKDYFLFLYRSETRIITATAIKYVK